MAVEYKTTDYCRVCGESPESATHVVAGHSYAPPNTTQPIPRRPVLDLLDDEEQDNVKWIRDFLKNPLLVDNDPLSTLQDAGLDMLNDLLEFLDRYTAAHNQLRAAQLLKGD